jgi:ribosomal protein S6
MEKETKNTGDLATVYEVSYLLLPSLALEQVSSALDFLVQKVKELDGEVISSENPILIDLAYPMTKILQTTRHKCQTGYFGWIKFELQDGIGEIKKLLDSNNDILRYLIVKTVRENTLLNGKMLFKGGDGEKKEEVFSVTLPELTLPESTPEEIDKSIDDLVIV